MWAWLILGVVTIGLLLVAHRLVDVLLPPREARQDPTRVYPSLRSGGSPFRLCVSLLTPPELHFYQALAVAIAGEHLVLAKVRMGDLLEVPPGTPDEQAWRNRVQSKHFDFVICDRLRVGPIVAIELDDSSHRRRHRVERDDAVDGFCRDAGLALVRFRVERSFDHRVIGERLAAYLSPARPGVTAPPLPSP